MTKTFLLSAVASVLIWGMYPVAVAMGGYQSPFVAAAVATSLAATAWAVALIISGAGLGHLLGRARHKAGLFFVTGLLFAAEVGLFYIAINRSPQTAAVLFEIWVLSFVVMSQIGKGRTSLSRQDWLFLCFGLLGVSVAVVDVRAMLSGAGSIPDPVSVICALLSGSCMGVKTYLNAKLAEYLQPKPGVAVASLPHLLSSLVAVPLWLAMAYWSGDGFGVGPMEAQGIILVAVLYAIGVPLFIYTVSLRPNDSVMAIFYTIPLVAIVLLALFGFGALTFYFVIGASIIFISNVMVTQSNSYVSAAGLASVLTLLATYFAVSVQTNVLPIASWVSTDQSIVALEILLVFYGLLFAFVLTNVLTTNKLVHGKMDLALHMVLNANLPQQDRRALYSRLLKLLYPRKAPSRMSLAVDYESQIPLQEIEIEYRSLNSGNTPTAIFHVFSVGVMAVLLGTFCLSDDILERLTGFLVLSCVLYFVFYSRDSYARHVTYPLMLSEVFHQHRGKLHTLRYAKRRGTHLVGLLLFVYTVAVCAALNIFLVPLP